LSKAVIIVTRQTVEDLVIFSSRKDTLSHRGEYISRQAKSSRQDAVINSFRAENAVINSCQVDLAKTVKFFIK